MPRLRPGDTARCRIEEQKPSSTSSKAHNAQAGADKEWGSGEAKEGVGTAVLPSASLGRQSLEARGESRLQGRGNKDETAYHKKTLSADQRSHPREGQDFWREDKERNREFPRPADLTPRWQAAVPE